MPLLSVIIPAYNREALIGQTLDSVFAQQSPADAPPAELEVIVVDDGSTDGTLRVVDRYGDRVRVSRQQNKGPGAARNVGIHAATGEYIAFLDSDDLWFPWTAATYARMIGQHNRPAFIAGKPFVFESSADPMPKMPQELSTLVFADYYASGDQWRWYSASSFVMRRDALRAVGGFTDEWVNAEDADAALRMGDSGVFVQILSPFTFAYRRHAGSAMANLTRSFEGVFHMIREEQAGRYPGGSARANERVRIICNHARALSVSLLAGHDGAMAWKLYGHTFRWHLRLHRWKFLAGFPVQAIIKKLLPLRK